jgi:hypothetical protein
VLGDIINQAALSGRIQSNTTYKDYKIYNTTLCVSGSYFRKYHDYIAKKKKWYLPDGDSIFRAKPRAPPNGRQFRRAVE